MKLQGKTFDEVQAALREFDHDQCVRLVFTLANFEQLLTASRIAKESCVDVREVLADMRAGRFVDPIFGRGFFKFGRTSYKVSRSAANEWRREWFVRLEDSIPGKKKKRRRRDIGVDGKNGGQMGAGRGPNDGEISGGSPDVH